MGTQWIKLEGLEGGDVTAAKVEVDETSDRLVRVVVDFKEGSTALPTDAAILAAVAKLTTREVRFRGGWYGYPGHMRRGIEVAERCGHCGGLGRFADAPCPSCGGSGKDWVY